MTQPQKSWNVTSAAAYWSSKSLRPDCIQEEGNLFYILMAGLEKTFWLPLMEFLAITAPRKYGS